MSPFRRPVFSRMGLNLKILLTLSLILLGFAVTSGIVFNVIQRRELKLHLQQQGEMMVRMLSGSLQPGLFFGDRASISQAVETLLSTKTYQKIETVTVYDPQEEVVLRRILSPTGHLEPHSRQLTSMATALANCRANPGPGEILEEEDMVIFTMPVSVEANRKDSESLFFDTGQDVRPTSVVGYAQVVLCKGQFNKTVRKTTLQTAALTILFLVFSLMATYSLTHDIMMPLQQLINTIRQRSGQTSEEPDEMGLLSDTFTRLVDDLEKAFATIQDLQDGLETTVAVRTEELSRALNELKGTQTQLVQSEKMVAIGRLVAGVAHEINNTTNFISGALPSLRRRLDELERLLQEPEGEPPDIGRREVIFSKLNMLLDNISEGTRRTSMIVSELRNFSRPVDELPGPVDINQCLRTTCSLAYPEYKHRLQLTLELAEDLPLVEGASGQLNQVFMNLLLNAIQAQPDRGAVLIRTWPADDAVHILFRDKGPGMTAEVIDRIFEPFFTTKEPGKGTGLGLSISYGIIQKHQGQILVRSEPGSGAEFEIILPRRRQSNPSIITEERA